MFLDFDYIELTTLYRRDKFREIRNGHRKNYHISNIMSYMFEYLKKKCNSVYFSFNYVF